MSLADQITADVELVFLNTNDFAVPVVVTRECETGTANLTAVVSASQFQVATEFGYTTVETRDFTFTPAMLDFGNGAVLPKRGDIFAEGGANHIVTSPNQQTAFYSLDETRQLMTVHTVKTK